MLAEPLNMFLCENLTLDLLLDVLQQEWQCTKPPIVVGQIAWGLVLEQMDVENKTVKFLWTCSYLCLKFKWFLGREFYAFERTEAINKIKTIKDKCYCGKSIGLDYILGSKIQVTRNLIPLIAYLGWEDPPNINLNLRTQTHWLPPSSAAACLLTHETELLPTFRLWEWPLPAWVSGAPHP